VLVLSDPSAADSKPVPAFAEVRRHVAPPAKDLAPWAIGATAVGAAALGGGIFLGMNAESARAQVASALSGPLDSQGRVVSLTQAQAQVLDSRARFESLGANVAFGVAAAAAVTGLLLLWLDRGASASGRGSGGATR
jgi:hypothetical protein